MGKIITVQRKENEGQLAENYIRTYILFPSGLLGLLAMIIGILALVYQLFFETYDEWTFIKSSGLMLAGILLGWGQTRYHRYLFRAFPEFWASRMKSSNSAWSATIQEKLKLPVEVELRHAGRSLVPVAYLLGIGCLTRAFGVELQFRFLGLYGSFCFAVGGIFLGQVVYLAVGYPSFDGYEG